LASGQECSLSRELLRWTLLDHGSSGSGTSPSQIVGLSVACLGLARVVSLLHQLIEVRALDPDPPADVDRGQRPGVDPVPDG
jgi:hypothetical protein